MECHLYTHWVILCSVSYLIHSWSINTTCLVIMIDQNGTNHHLNKESLNLPIRARIKSYGDSLRTGHELCSLAYHSAYQIYNEIAGYNVYPVSIVHMWIVTLEREVYCELVSIRCITLPLLCVEEYFLLAGWSWFERNLPHGRIWKPWRGFKALEWS